MKILLTGVPGWLGNRLLEILMETADDAAVPDNLIKQFSGADISCLVLPDQNLSTFQRYNNGNIHFHRGDLTVKDSLSGFMDGAEGSTLFHLAGLIHPKKKVNEIWDVNVNGSKNLLDSAIEKEVRKIVIISSNSPIGCNPNRNHIFNEESPYNPYMAYGKSKMKLEQMIEDYNTRFDVDITVIRPCWFYGPNQPQRQSVFFNMIKNGKAPLVGDGGNRRSMSYVDNTCQAILLAAVKPEARGQTYWVADEEPYTMKEIIDTVGQVLKEDFGFSVIDGYFRLPSFASEIALLVDRMMQGIGSYNQKIHVLSEMNKNIACSISKAKRELGYNPMISLKDGMRRSVAWCIDHGHPL